MIDERAPGGPGRRGAAHRAGAGLRGHPRWRQEEGAGGRPRGGDAGEGFAPPVFGFLRLAERIFVCVFVALLVFVC